MQQSKFKTFEQYLKDEGNLKKEYIEIDVEIDNNISANELIELLQRLQIEYNTTDLMVSTKVTDSYYEQSNIVVLRLENDTELLNRVRYHYNLDKNWYEQRVEKENKQKQIEELKRQQDALQAKINELR